MNSHSSQKNNLESLRNFWYTSGQVLHVTLRHNIWLTERHFWLMVQIHVFQIIFSLHMEETRVGYKSHSLAVIQAKTQTIKYQKQLSTQCLNTSNKMGHVVFKTSMFYHSYEHTSALVDGLSRSGNLIIWGAFLSRPTNSTITEQQTVNMEQQLEPAASLPPIDSSSYVQQHPRH